MITGYLTIGILQTLAVIAPGPDFAVVVKNTLTHSRRAGIITALGISCGVLFHMSYCLFGLAFMIKTNPLLFNIIKYIGCGYLVYIGIKAILHKSEKPSFSNTLNQSHLQS